MAKLNDTGAEAVVRASVERGVEVCFANPGTTEMWFVGALDSVPGIRPVLGLHETVCTGAADGYGRMARRPAMTLLHLGPGLANGLANLHNARRARTPIVNVVGDMATWHAGADALLAMDIEGLAGTVSSWVRTSSSPGGIVGDMAEAIDATGDPTCTRGRVSTLIIPHDRSWETDPVDPAAPAAGPMAALHVAGGGIPPGLAAFLAGAAKALQAAPRGKAAIYLGGAALLRDGKALENAGLVAAATGAALICENAFARLDRGTGLPSPTRLPYFPQEAAKELSRYTTIVTVDARLPVAMFGYLGGPSQLMGHVSEDDVWEIDRNAPEALQALADLVGVEKVVPGKNCGGLFPPPARPPPPAAGPGGRLTAPAMCAVVARLQPEGAVVVDESLTSGGAYWDVSKGCPPFAHLTLTGGAIGCGPPLAVGAAIARPGSRVINLQADGSAQYSLQAMWTQAREELDIVTVVCANRSYAILKLELMRQKIPSGGTNAKALTEIDRPTIDWVQLASGYGVPAVSVATAEDLGRELTAALARKGPSLIEALLA